MPIHKIVQNGGRYLYEETFGFQETLAEQEGLKPITSSRTPDPARRCTRPYWRSLLPPSRSSPPIPGYEAGERAAQLHRRQSHQRAAHENLRPRREGHGRRQSRRRPHLRLQSEQSDRHPDPARRHRMAAREQAEGRHPAARRSLHPYRRRADVLRPGRQGQGHHHPPHLLQDLRHGRAARGRGIRASRPARRRSRRTAPARCRSPAWRPPPPA